MFEEYQAEVYAEYLKSKESNIVLANPKPSGLRDEALLLKNNREGAEVLRFFSSDGTKNDKLDIDKFRPVQKFLTGKTNEPNNRVVEFVAWLIDFQPRPFETWKNVRIDELEDKKVINDEVNITTDTEEGLIDLDPNNVDETEAHISQANLDTNKLNETQVGMKKFNFIYRTGIIAILGLILGVAYWKSIPPENCMYWTGSKYKAISCNEKNPNIEIVALNQYKLNHFKKIIQTDTMTFNSLNNVWYSKIDNEVEFFTAKGKHPINRDRILKPITLYILGKYGNHGMLSLTKTNATDTTEKD